MVGVVAVGERLAVVAVEPVHALLVRVAGGGDGPETPFAEGSGGVASILEVVENGLCPLRKRELSLRRNFEVAPDIGVSAVRARHKAGAGRGAHRRTGITLRETKPVSGQGIDVGSAEQLLSIAAEISPAEIVGEYEHHIRFRLFFCCLPASHERGTGGQSRTGFCHSAHYLDSSIFPLSLATASFHLSVYPGWVKPAGMPLEYGEWRKLPSGS